jgi:hypothetical protein
VTITRSLTVDGVYSTFAAPNQWTSKELLVSSAVTDFSGTDKFKFATVGGVTTYTYNLATEVADPLADNYFYKVSIVTKYDDSTVEAAVDMNVAGILATKPTSYPAATIPAGLLPTATALYGDNGITGQVNNVLRFTGPLPTDTQL